MDCLTSNLSGSGSDTGILILKAVIHLGTASKKIEILKPQIKLFP